MTDENLDELEIVLTRTVNPNVVCESRISLTGDELWRLIGAFHLVATDANFYNELVNDPLPTLEKTCNLSAETTRSLENILDNIDKILPPPTPPTVLF